MNTVSNLQRYLTVDYNGPQLTGAPVRVFRRKLRQTGRFLAKTKKALKAERPKPYIRGRG